MCVLFGHLLRFFPASQELNLSTIFAQTEQHSIRTGKFAWNGAYLSLIQYL